MMRHAVRLVIFVLIFSGVLMLAGAAAPVNGEESPIVETSPKLETESQEEKAESKQQQSEGACLVDEAALEDLRKQRETWASRVKELTVRENELKSREAALNEEFRKFEALRGDLSKVEVSRKQENDARVSKLVETFETMSPKAASALIGSLDESLAVAAMSKIATQKLAKIMNVMEPKRSARLTELMAGVVRAREAAGKRSNAASDDADEITPLEGTAVPAPKAGAVDRKGIRKGGENT